MPSLKIRIDMDGRGLIGPGKVDLLEAVDRCGSIRGAAKAIGMSYRRAWLLLTEIETIMGAPALSTGTGGSGGGGASLSPVGRAIIEHYRAIEARALSATAADLKALAKLGRKSRKTPRKTASRRSREP